MKSHPSCRAFANTHSDVHMSIPVLPFYGQGAHIVGRYRHKCLILSRSGLACCNPCQPTCCPTPLSFWCFFLYSPFYRDTGSPFDGQVQALISNCWVQPSQPTPTPTIASSLSGCLLTHVMSSLSSLHTIPIALSAVAMFLLCFWNELLGIRVEDRTHRHRLTQPAVHVRSRAGLLSTRVELV